MRTLLVYALMLDMLFWICVVVSLCLNFTLTHFTKGRLKHMNLITLCVKYSLSVKETNLIFCIQIKSKSESSAVIILMRNNWSQGLAFCCWGRNYETN